MEKSLQIMPVDEALRSTAYFADPYASWQRGSNENFNGLLRQYIPKKRSLSTVTADELKIQDLINHRPRKRLGFKNAAQSLSPVFKACCTSYLNARV
jgi:transposase, IS30 family